MGLRDRLKERLKGVLGTPAATPTANKAAVPVPPVAPPSVSPVAPPSVSPVAPPPVSPVAPPAVSPVAPPTVSPAGRTPVPTEPPAAPSKPTAVVQPTEVAAPDAKVATPPAVVSTPPVAAAAVTPSTSALRFVADSADAPVRNTHIAKVREATGEGFRVHYHNADEKFDLTVVVEPGEFLLDAVERLGAVLPYSCRNGGCLSCTAKLVAGTYEMGEQYTLEEDQIERGFFLLCCSHPTSDMELITHMADEVA